jgi:hypothetical protein
MILLNIIVALFFLSVPFIILFTVFQAAIAIEYRKCILTADTAGKLKGKYWGYLWTRIFFYCIAIILGYNLYEGCLGNFITYDPDYNVYVYGYEHQLLARNLSVLVPAGFVIFVKYCLCSYLGIAQKIQNYLYEVIPLLLISFVVYICIEIKHFTWDFSF